MPFSRSRLEAQLLRFVLLHACRVIKEHLLPLSIDIKHNPEMVFTGGFDPQPPQYVKQ